jgi:hypothetical protein
MAVATDSHHSLLPEKIGLFLAKTKTIRRNTANSRVSAVIHECAKIARHANINKASVFNEQRWKKPD